MSVNLQKGQKVNLRKTGGQGTLKRVMVGLGWDEAKGLLSMLLFRSYPGYRL